MKSYKFPVKECKVHAFCNYPYTEDVANLESKDLKSYLRDLSPNKKYNLSEREIITTNTLPNELDVKYLKQIQERMDDYNSVKSGIPIVTEEGLSDWCQQSINRRFPVIPNSRPFMVSKPIFEYLKSVQDLKKSHQSLGGNSASRELMTQGEIQNIIEGNKVKIHSLEPRTMDNGTSFIYPRLKEKDKPRRNLQSEISGNLRTHSANTSKSSITYTRARSSVMSQILHQFKTEVKEFHGNLRTDAYKATEIYENAIKDLKAELATSTTRDSFRLYSDIQKKLLDSDQVMNEESSLLIHTDLIIETHGNLANISPLKADWNATLLELKSLFKTNGSSLINCYNIGVCLERLSCYENSRNWFSEALKINQKSSEILFGLALTCYKLKEIGSCIYFCEKILVNNEPKDGKVYFLLALCSRIINNIEESTLHYMLLLQRCPEDKYSPIALNQEWDEIMALDKWMYKSRIPFFRRFDKKKLKSISQYEILRLESTHVFVPDKDKSYIALNGMIKVRDHSQDLTRPKLMWRIRTGHYLHYPIHQSFYENEHFWMFIDRNSSFLTIPNTDFANLLKDSKGLNSIVLMNILKSFSIFKELSDNSVSSIVQESLKVKKFKKTQLIRRKIGSDEGKGNFGIILSGLCDLKREDGQDISIEGRGDYFAEEFLFRETKGIASYGDIYARSDTVEIGFITGNEILRLPEYELEIFKSCLFSCKKSKTKKEAHLKNKSFWL